MHVQIPGATASLHHQLIKYFTRKYRKTIEVSSGLYRLKSLHDNCLEAEEIDLVWYNNASDTTYIYYYVMVSMFLNELYGELELKFLSIDCIQTKYRNSYYKSTLKVNGNRKTRPTWTNCFT